MAIPQWPKELLGQLPLYVAVANRQMRLIGHIRRTRIQPSLLKSREPTVVIVADDDGASTGPAGWPQAEFLLRWAGSALLHGAGAEAGHYGMAVALAITGHLLVETSSARLEEWRGLASRLGVPSIAIRPRGGLPHPQR